MFPSGSVVAIRPWKTWFKQNYVSTCAIIEQMFLDSLSRHGLAKCYGETCGEEKSSVSEAVKLQGPYAVLDYVAGQSSLEIVTLTKL